MLLVIYDIESDKLRNKLSSFLKQFGRRLQYSVFEIKNSPRILANIRVELRHNYENEFTQSDSVMIINIPDDSIIDRFGYAKNEESDLLIF